MLVVRAWCAREKRTKVFRAQRAKTEIIINKLKYGPIYEWAIKIPKTKCEKKMRANATALKHFGNVYGDGKISGNENDTLALFVSAY